MLSQHFCFSLSPKFYLYPSHCCTPSFWGIIIWWYSKCVLYYDSAVECHAREYSIFAAIAYCVLVLIYYLSNNSSHSLPHKTVQKMCLHTFVESFQGEYKDGTNGTRDFMDAFCIILHSQDTDTVPVHKSPSYIFQQIIALLACAFCMHAITRPYKLNFMNNVDIVILVLLILVTSNNDYSGNNTAVTHSTHDTDILHLP